MIETEDFAESLPFAVPGLLPVPVDGVLDVPGNAVVPLAVVPACVTLVGVPVDVVGVEAAALVVEAPVGAAPPYYIQITRQTDPPKRTYDHGKKNENRVQVGSSTYHRS